jgi:hypothetical protein
MKKVLLILIFIFIILPIILLAIVGVDVYLTVSNFSPEKVSLDVSEPVAGLSADNKTLNFMVNINLTTPQAGFIPKSLTLTVTLFYNTTTQIGEPFVVNLELGTTSFSSINQSILLSQSLTDSLAQGDSVSVTVKSLASIGVFGITIPYSFNVPDQTFNLP